MLFSQGQNYAIVIEILNFHKTLRVGNSVGLLWPTYLEQRLQTLHIFFYKALVYLCKVWLM
jgi:hypothetical protein